MAFNAHCPNIDNTHTDGYPETDNGLKSQQQTHILSVGLAQAHTITVVIGKIIHEY